MRTLLLLFTTLAFSTSALSQVCTDVFLKERPHIKREIPSLKENFLKLDNGRDIYFESMISDDASKPLVIFVNGLVWRQQGFRPSMSLLQAFGIDSASMSFSVHPESLQNKSEMKQLQAAVTDVTMDSLANEVVELATKLRKPGQKVVVTSLSYSGGLLGRILRQAPEMIDHAIAISPLVSAGEVDPGGMGVVKNIESAMSMNPFLGNAGIASFRHAYTEKYIGDALKSRGPEFLPKGVSASAARMGITRLARAAEEYDLRKDFKPTDKKIHFILGTGEVYSRLKNQVEGFTMKRQQNNESQLVLIPNAPHVTFAVDPGVTSIIISILASGVLPAKDAGMMVYLPDVKDFKVFNPSNFNEAMEITDRTIKAYPQKKDEE